MRGPRPVPGFGPERAGLPSARRQAGIGGVFWRRRFKNAGRPSLGVLPLGRAGMDNESDQVP